MAMDLKPPAWFAGMSEDATDVSIPIASLPELIAAEADADTGDIRKFMFAVMAQLWAAYDALDAADKPTQMVMSKNSSVNQAGDQVTHFFSLQFTNTVATQDVADEPA